jgi:formylglycine-generating enzyme required for sulfatase activity
MKLRKREIILIISAFLITIVGIRASDYLNTKKVKDDLFSPCPADMVYVESAQGAFCIDKYEASASNKCPEKNPASQLDTRLNLSDSACKPVSRAQALPWVNISRDQAKQACAKAGKRLPTAAEWQAASLGTPDKSSGWGPNDCQLNSNWSHQPGLTGSGVNCRSAAGAYDMIGNVWEWVTDEVKDGVYQGRSLPTQGYVVAMSSDGLPAQTRTQTPDPNYNNDYFWLKQKGVRAIMLGGYWQNKDQGGQYSAYAVSYPSFAGSGVGFRCVKKPSF